MPPSTCAATGGRFTLLEPEIRLYKSSQSQNTVVGLRRALNEDLYVVYSGVLHGRKQSNVPVLSVAAGSWIWIGFWIVLFGTVICLVPSKVRYQYARTEVVGIAK